MKVIDRSKMFTRVTTLKDADDAGDLRRTSTAEQRWEMVWELSTRLYAFKEGSLAEPGLQRHPVRILRKER